MKKIKIAFLTKNLRINGISTVLMNYAKRLDNKKYDITILTGNPIAEKHIIDCKKYNINLIITPQKRTKNPFKYYKFLYKILSENKYDIVHIHGNSATITLELLIAKLCKIKTRITHSHNTTCDHKNIHYLLRPFMNCILSERFACGFDAGKWLYGNKKFKIINNGFDIEKFKFSPENRKNIRKQLGVEDKVVIGHVGIFTDQKNHEFIIDVFENIATKSDNYVLLLVGSGPNFERIRNRVNDSIYKDRIILYGETNNVKELYDAMDIFFLPSKYEGLVVVLLEAQIEGLPCLISDNVSKEGVFNDTNVYFLNLGQDIETWSRKLSSLEPSDESKRIQYINENYEIVRKYEINQNVKELENIYLQLVNK